MPLRVMGLGAGLLSPTCSPLALMGGSKTSDPLARRNLCRLSSSDPPKLPEAEAPLAAPLPLSKGLPCHQTLGSSLLVAAGTVGLTGTEQAADSLMLQ